MVDFRLKHWTASPHKLFVISRPNDNKNPKENEPKSLVFGCIAVRTKKSDKSQGKLDLWSVRADSMIEMKKMLLEAGLEALKRKGLSSVVITIKDSNEDDISLLKENGFVLKNSKPVTSMVPGLHICHEVLRCTYVKMF